MDALLSALLACLLCELGGSNQKLALALSRRFQQDGIVVMGICCAVFINVGLSAAGGEYLSTLLSADARTLLLALALFLGGLQMLLPVKDPDPLNSWGVGAFATALLGTLILGFGDAAQFIVFGLASRTSAPVFAAIGGALGIIIASAPVAILRRPLLSASATLAVRRTGGGLLALIGTVLGLTAVKML